MIKTQKQLTVGLYNKQSLKKTVCLISCLFMSLLMNAQVVGKGLTKVGEDSILNEITNIDKRLKTYTTKNNRINDYSKTVRAGQNLPVNNNISTIVPSLVNDTSVSDLLSTQWEPFPENISFDDTIIIDPIFLPVVFDGRILPSNLIFFKLPNKQPLFGTYHLISPDSTFVPFLARAKEIQKVRTFYYTTNPDKIKLNAFTFAKGQIIKEQKVKSKNAFDDLLSPDNPIDISKPEIEKFEIKKVYWIKRGEHALQVNQNSVSDNWFTGGTNNFNILNYHRFEVNYKKDKISFNNILEWKLNMMNNVADTLHKVTIMEDFVRTYSVLGVQAFKKWSYTTNMLIETPLFNNYVVNQQTKRAAFLTPLRVNIGVGMGYKLEKISPKDKYRKLVFGADLSPVSLNYIYANDTSVDRGPLGGGLVAGKNSNLIVGSSVIMNLNYSINRFLGMTSRFKYFTNYESSLMESENRFNMNLNKFLSASVYLYGRYDDTVPPKDDSFWGYFQYNQILGFGLNYKW